MITQDLGIATAYGYAKSKGYTGTEAEFAELMASYASTAQTAIEAADRAVEANTAAQSAKTDAAASKTAAQTAAQTATTAASEASTSADTASAAATSASTSAQTATTAASTANTKASEAAASANMATTAKTDAETARDAAAQSASDAAASAESIDPETLEHKAYGAYVVESASGAIASFADGADSIPMKDVLVHIEPVQEGSGDPSPDNVRHITGWTGAKVTRTGKNLYCGTKATSISIIYGGMDNTAKVIDEDYTFKPGTYRVSLEVEGTSSPSMFFSTKVGGVWTGPINRGKVTTFTFTVPENCEHLEIWAYGTGFTALKNIQIELGSATATAYEPSNGETINITFPTEAGTVYSGTLDVTSGVLTVTDAQIASYAGETLPGEWISDRDVYVAGTTPTTGAQVAYELATPITYTLTPQEITSLLGTNNVWADTGNTEVEYRASTKMYIDKKITEAVSALS